MRKAGLFALLVFAMLVSQAAADTPARMDVTGFGATASYQAVMDGGQAYISVETLAKALKLGIREDGIYTILSWGGKSVKVAKGTIYLGQASLPAPVTESGGKLYFPVKGITAFGAKLTYDEKTGNSQVSIPRAQITGMGKLPGDGPSVYYVQLSWAPSQIESFVLSAPDRLVIDLSETIVDPQQSKDLAATEATRIRASMNKPGVARVVLELTKSGAGGKVYQDKDDPSLIKIAYPGRITSIKQVELQGVPAYEVRGTAGFAASSIKQAEGGMLLFMPDFTPDKSLQAAGKGYKIVESGAYGSLAMLDLMGLVPGQPYFEAGLMTIPLRNVMAGIKASMEGALMIRIEFASPLKGFTNPEEIGQGKARIMLSNVAAVIPQVIEGLMENGISIAIQENADGSAELALSGLPSGIKSATASEDGKLLSISFGGVVTGVALIEDNGVTRGTFTYAGQVAEARLVSNQGAYMLVFPGITGTGKGVEQAYVLSGKGGMSWESTPEGLALRLELSDGYLPVLRQGKAQGTAVLDIGLAILGYTVRKSETSIKIMISSAGEIKPEVFRLREPDRLVVDLPGHVDGTQRSEEITDAGIVVKARSAQNTIGVARMVFDLTRYLGHTWSLAEDGRSVVITLAETLSGLNGRLILIDPGHGGTDGGAVGNGLKEKDINLDIALRLRALLEAQGATVVMTRSSDARVELLERSAMANLLLPDVVVCIHSNSVISEGPNGTETYYFNHQELSRELALSVQKSLVDRIKLANRGVFSKDYHMVTATLSPSILIEVGFLSNKQDSSMLADSAFRQKAAEGIFDGVASYFGGTAHEKWAAVREAVISASQSYRFGAGDAGWPGLMVYEPWVPEVIQDEPKDEPKDEPVPEEILEKEPEGHTNVNP